eukprot:3573711-Amphidinium_carterae.1
MNPVHSACEADVIPLHREDSSALGMNSLGAGEEAERRPLGPAVIGAPGGAQGTNDKDGAALS